MTNAKPSPASQAPIAQPVATEPAAPAQDGDDYQVSLIFDVATDKYRLVTERLSADFGLQEIESVDLFDDEDGQKVA